MFKLRADVYQVQTRRALLDNGITVQVGDVIAPTSSGDIVSNATALVAGDKYPLGVVIGFSKKNGEVIGQGQDPSLTPNQLTTPANNTTTTQYYAVYIPITPDMEFSATLDAPAGTTTGSDKAFMYFNLADCRTINESSVAAPTGSPLQVVSMGLDPEDPSGNTIICRFVKAFLYRP